MIIFQFIQTIQNILLRISKNTFRFLAKHFRRLRDRFYLEKKYAIKFFLWKIVFNWTSISFIFSHSKEEFGLRQRKVFFDWHATQPLSENSCLPHPRRTFFFLSSSSLLFLKMGVPCHLSKHTPVGECGCFAVVKICRTWHQVCLSYAKADPCMLI